MCIYFQVLIYIVGQLSYFFFILEPVTGALLSVLAANTAGYLGIQEHFISLANIFHPVPLHRSKKPSAAFFPVSCSVPIYGK